MYEALSNRPKETGKMKVSYREKRYICGEFTEIQIFPVYPVRCKGGKRAGKRNPSTEMQKKLNERNAKRKLSRLVHCNFRPRDYAVTFTYEDGRCPETEQEAKKQIQSFLRRARYLYKKQELCLKYIWVMERAESTGRIHFHAIMSGGVDRTQLEELWGHGYANIQSLKFNGNGIEGLVQYILKDKPLTYRRWSCSKNLDKPVERQNDSRITFRRAKRLFEAYCDYEEFRKIYPQSGEVLSDCEILDIQVQLNEFNGEYYIGVRTHKKKGECACTNRQRRCARTIGSMAADKSGVREEEE